MPAKIPGYVYDEGKGKYFKILPDHAVPSGSSYSRTAVAEGERRTEDLLKRDEFHQRQLRHQVQRSVILGLHPLGGFMGVQREHGSHEGHQLSDATALGIEKAPILHTIRMGPPVRDEGGDNRPYIATTPAYNIDLSDAMRRFGFNTLWASAAGPHQGDHNEFAVGTSNGVLLVRVGRDRWKWDLQQSRWPGDEHSADTFAVEFWGSSSVLAGMRNGKVRLWDTRSQGAGVRFQHASCVVDIKTLDQNRILVAGLKDKLCIYDARFSKAFPQSQQTDALPSSRPIHTFPNYSRKSITYPKLGFDVHENLVAVGTEDKKIQLFDIKSGREVAFGNQPGPSIVDRHHASCLKFVGDENRGDGMRLLVANGPYIDAWTW
ncbi:MAG: hypothetical protein Q9212_001753 [Teloschistes hypoglaucus]